MPRGATSSRRSASPPSVVEEMTNMLSAIRPRDQYKAPKYKGDGDVELYIRQFMEVSDANRWQGRQAVIHLRSSLEGPALDCGRGDEIGEIFAALRARYGLTARQAKDKLAGLHKGPKQTMHGHATDVGRLVEIAFNGLPPRDRNEMALDYFTRSLDNKALQRHMLAVTPVTMMDAVKAAEEFIQIGGADGGNRPTAMTVETVELDKPTSAIEASLASIGKVLEAQSIMMDKLVSCINRMEKPVSEGGGERFQRRRPLACYNCQGPHLKRNCPHPIAAQTNPVRHVTGSGNEAGPNQP